jgi:hypothetical protein
MIHKLRAGQDFHPNDKLLLINVLAVVARRNSIANLLDDVAQRYDEVA